jgi:hypothetical protein
MDFPGVRRTSFTLTPQLAVVALVSTANEAHCRSCQAPSGIVLTDDVRKRMRGLSGKEGRRVGTQSCVELIDALVPQADAFYLIPQQRFTDIAVDLVTHITRCCQERRKTG